MQFKLSQTWSVLTYSIVRVTLEKPFLLVGDGLRGKAEAPQSPANVVPGPQRNILLLTVQHEGGQQGHEDPHS